MSQPSWKFRRRAIFGSLLFAASIILYVAVRWDDNNIGDTLALGAFGLMGAIVASYIGGATYQDVKLYRQMSLNDKQYPEEQIDQLPDEYQDEDAVEMPKH